MRMAYNIFQRSLITLYHQVYKAYYTCFMIQTLHGVYYSLLAFLIGGQKLEWKTHWQSPVCREILRRKYYISRSKSLIYWGILNSLLASILLFDLKAKSITSLFISYSDVIWYLEVSLIFTFTFNACIAAWFYIWSVVTMPISPIQRTLFGINEKDPVFELKKKQNAEKQKDESGLLYKSWFDSDQSSFMSVTPLNYSANSWASSPSYGLDSSSSSWTFFRPSSPDNYTSTPKTKQNDNTAARKYILPDSPDSLKITNNKQLEEFLKVCEDEDKKLKSFEDSMHGIQGLDNSPLSILGKCRYQRACRLPSMETIESNSSEMHYGDTLSKLKITEKMLTRWCEKLRKWICQTILVRLVAEIEEINNSLSQVGLPEYQIGTVNLFALHQIAVTKFQHLATLPAVLPYLDMHLNQEYLVQRLKDLAKGGCLSDFKWNSGGTYGDKAWCDDLPTDCAILQHILCCYLDAYLPPEPHFPEGKPFTCKYFKKTPEKLVLAKDAHFIYQSCVIPPHFKVVIGQDIYSLQKGRNNLFHAFLIFFHYLKTKESGMLGRVNLGPSGLNILWVVD